MTNKTEPKAPFILNLFKPAGITSYDAIRVWKRKLKPYGKVGHFGTLDPFASGVLMIGVGGAQRLNNYIHDYLPKTYIAIGKLGVETETGDLTVGPSQVDESDYLKDSISEFSKEFIEQKLREKFLGSYMQAPHKYSAAKFEGKALHKWAREGVEIKKEKKERQIYKIEVIKYAFPYLSIRFEVSSGTYIRTLFSDCANYLGTLGTLVSLVREKVGGCNIKNAVYKGKWGDEEFDVLKIDDVLKFDKIILAQKEAKLYSNGVNLKLDRIYDRLTGENSSDEHAWVCDIDKNILGLSHIENGEFRAKVNFSS